MTDGASQQDRSFGGTEELLKQLDRHIADPEFRERLKQSLRRLTDLKFALDESAIVAMTDRRGTIEYVNDKFCEISGYSRDELIGQDHRIINSGYHPKSYFRDMWRTIASGNVWRGEFRNRAKDGRLYWVLTTIVPLCDERGRPRQYLAIRQETTKLKQTEEQLQFMVNQVMGIQERERLRLSRELHDGIGQSLFSLLIRIDRMIAGAPALKDELEGLRSQVADMMQEVRSLARDLRPSVLDDLGVVPAIRSYIDSFTSHYGVKVKLDSRISGRLTVEKETAVYRVVQEALTNIGKYADVDEASVSLAIRDGWLEARIEDKGAGFVRGEVPKGVGLFSMEERARAVGGTLTVESAPGRGTTVLLRVPVSE